MQNIVVFATLLACAAAAPGILLSHAPVVATVHAAPVVHAVPVVASRTTITKSSQLVNHGTPHVVQSIHTPVITAPVVVRHAPVVHAVPVVHAAPVVHAPVVIKTAPVAVAHSSSVVHHHTPIVKSVPIFAVHH